MSFPNNRFVPFLDVLVMKNCTIKLEFDEFRKDRHAQGNSPNDSHHSRQHKITSFNFWFLRLLTSQH